MRVVVTRPQRSGEKTAALLRARGHEPVMLPLTRPLHNGSAAVEFLAKGPTALAITSAEAIRALQTSHIDLSAHTHLPVFTVGEATAKAARDAGFQNILIGEGDGRVLAHLVITSLISKPHSDAHLLYLAGAPREAGFEETLAASGVKVDIAEIYEMQQIAWEKQAVEALFGSPPDAVLLYSRQTARMFFELIATFGVAPFLRRSTYICISEKVLSVVPEEFRSAAVASDLPSEATMMQLLDQATGT